MKRTVIVSAAAVLIAAAPLMSMAATDKTDSRYVNKEYTTSDTISCIGSVSKMFATTAAMQLAEQGKIDIDAPVTDYIPEFRMADERYKDITVRMLMNHTSGLMGTTAGDFMLYDDRDSTPHDTFLKELSTQRLKADPGDFGAYCNDGFELLEILVERVSGESFTDYVEKNICKPLDMQQTGTPWNVFRTEQQVETFCNGNVRIAPDYCLDLGSGGIMSTATELTRFGSAFFKGDTSLLSESSKQEMSKTDVTDKYEDGFGLGWDQVDYADYKSAGVKVVSKGGDVTHQHASLMVAPDEKISVSVLSSGGSSSCDTAMAMTLMDIALAEKGINIEHNAPAPKETLPEVPEKYLAYEDIYISGSEVYRVSFPERKYMEISRISSEKSDITQYMYTTEDNFVKMDGNIANGNAVQSRSQSVLSFQKRNGVDFICDELSMEFGDMYLNGYCVYDMQRAEHVSVSDEAQSAWDARSGKKYYFYNGKYSNVYYADMPCTKVMTFPEARGYVNAGKIIDSDHAKSSLAMPGGRDIMDIEMRYENGAEILDITNNAVEFISEDAIPLLPDDLTEVKLSTKKASWFSIGKAENKTINLDIPENAAVYVYDKYDHMTYSSYMKDYGNTVPLPSEGKIVFLGEDGGKISITQ